MSIVNHLRNYGCLLGTVKRQPSFKNGNMTIDHDQGSADLCMVRTILEAWINHEKNHLSNHWTKMVASIGLCVGHKYFMFEF